MIAASVSGIPDIERRPMFKVTQRELKQDDTGCEHSDLDGPVGRKNDYEEFRCPKCGNTIQRKLDESGKPNGESFIVVTR
jgi:predicted RNA-binding Zn-ribbon protein involved in translation (DUF1610 family)